MMSRLTKKGPPVAKGGGMELPALARVAGVLLSKWIIFMCSIYIYFNMYGWHSHTPFSPPPLSPWPPPPAYSHTLKKGLHALHILQLGPLSCEKYWTKQMFVFLALSALTVYSSRQKGTSLHVLMRFNKWNCLVINSAVIVWLDVKLNYVHVVFLISTNDRFCKKPGRH